MCLDVLTTSLGLKPSNTWKLGERRRTPAGKPLKGIRQDNFWTARLIGKRYATSPRRSLEPALASVSAKLAEHRALFRRIQRTGGGTELFVGIFGEGAFSFGSELPAELLSTMGKMGLSLSLDIYP
jgi:hypothetical protein